jgi:hypothetical protein
MESSSLLSVRRGFTMTEVPVHFPGKGTVRIDLMMMHISEVKWAYTYILKSCQERARERCAVPLHVG